MIPISSVNEYKCPCCGGAIEFNTASQNMKCPFCETEFDVDTLQNFASETVASPDKMEWQDEAGEELSADETAGMRVYHCESCGGEVVADETTAASTCPYCGNRTIMAGQLSGMLKPDLVIPFQFDKKAAVSALAAHYKGKRLLPKVFKDQNHLDEVKGIYVPFWLFDCDVDADIRYRGNRVRTWSDSRYNYTETSTYLITRAGSAGFDMVPVDGSQKMADDLMESVEPFDYSKAVPFSTAYLSGFFADKYDVTREESVPRANTRIRTSTEQAFAATVTGYSGVVAQSSNLQLNNGTAKYALLPVWLLQTSWNGKNYQFAMNGQSGKMVGDLPVDKGAFWKWFGIYTVAAAAAVFLAQLILQLL